MVLQATISMFTFLQLLLDKPRESIQVGVVYLGHPAPIVTL